MVGRRLYIAALCALVLGASGCAPDERTIIVYEGAGGAEAGEAEPADSISGMSPDMAPLGGEPTAEPMDPAPMDPAPNDPAPVTPEPMVPAPTTATVSGVVQRAGAAEDGHGGIRVEAVETAYSAVTTSSGRFRIEVEPGAYTLRFSSDGYGSEEVSIPELAAGDGFVLADAVVLTTNPGQVRGVVQLPPEFSDASRLETVVLALQAEDAADDAAPVAETRLNAEGRFVFESVAPGGYTLVVSTPGFLTIRRALSVMAGQRLRLDPMVLTLADLGQQDTAVEGVAYLYR